MLVFSTRFPLKDFVEANDCNKLFTEWVTGSQHYGVSPEDLKYEKDSPLCFSCHKENVSVEMRHYKDDKDDQQLELLSCRLINTEVDSMWINDCIFVSENGKKSLLVQLDCNNLEYDPKLKSAHKPHIIKMCFEKNYCGSDSDIPVSDTPFNANYYLDKCADIMNGKSDNSMPVVYISFDLFGKPRVDPKKLARHLGGIAHVFVEPSKNTSLSLKEKTEERNVHNGYFGIYYPKSEIHKTFNPEYYSDCKALEKEIIQTVQQSLINRSDAVLYTWDQIINLQARQKISEWKEISDTDKSELSDFLELYDKDISDKNKLIDELNRQIYSLQSQLDVLREQNHSKKAEGMILPTGEEKEFYEGEIKLLLISVLSQVKDRYPEDSRAYAIIKSLLDANPRTDACEKRVQTVKSVFSKGGALSKAAIKQLEDIGFIFQSNNSHKKMVFYDDRYQFSISNTPSDRRGGKNMASDIIKIINVEKNLF